MSTYFLSKGELTLPCEDLYPHELMKRKMCLKEYYRTAIFDLEL